MYVDANRISCVITKFQLSYWQGNHISRCRGALAFTPNIGVIYPNIRGNLPQKSGLNIVVSSSVNGIFCLDLGGGV